MRNLFFFFFSQRSDINPEDAPLDAERMNNFYQRALNESERWVQLLTVFLHYSCCQIVSKIIRRTFQVRSFNSSYRSSLFCLIVSNEYIKAVFHNWIHKAYTALVCFIITCTLLFYIMPEANTINAALVWWNSVKYTMAFLYCDRPYFLWHDIQGCILFRISSYTETR